MFIKMMLIILGVALATIASFVIISAHVFNMKIEKEITELIKDMRAAPIRTFTYSELEGLPEPVQRYFRYVLKNGQGYIRFVRLKQGNYKRSGTKLHSF